MKTFENFIENFELGDFGTFGGMLWEKRSNKNFNEYHTDSNSSNNNHNYNQHLPRQRNTLALV